MIDPSVTMMSPNVMICRCFRQLFSVTNCEFLYPLFINSCIKKTSCFCLMPIIHRTLTYKFIKEGNPEKLSFPTVSSRPPIPAAEGHLYNRHRQDKNKSSDMKQDKSPPSETNLKQIFEIYGQRIDGQTMLKKSPNSMSAQNLRSSDGWSNLPDTDV